jgi:hypothetical protein
MVPNADNRSVNKRSDRTVDKTLARLERTLEEQHVTSSQ